MKRIILCLFLLLLATDLILAKEPDWFAKMKQIKLLTHTYDDVINILGKPVDGSTEKELSEYFDFKEGKMFVAFASGLCGVTPESNGKPLGWKVPEFTVIEVSFSPDKHINPKKAFLNLNQFTKTPVKYSGEDTPPDDHRRALFSFEYENDDLGIYYFEQYGKITNVSFYPSKQFNHLRCSE